MTASEMQFSKTSDLNAADALVGAELLRIIQTTDVKVTVQVLLQAAMTLAVATNIDLQTAVPVTATDNILQAIGKLQAQMNKTVNEDDVGTAANQVPVNQLLGRSAFSDVVGAVQAYRHVHASEVGDVWFSRISDTQLGVHYHGDDNVVRSSTLVLS